MKFLVATAGLIAAVPFVVAGFSEKPEPKQQAPKIQLGNVTYADHVAKILNDRCTTCHHPGDVAPFSLVGYDNAKKYAATVKVLTANRKMPPWKAVHGYGEFLDENRLTNEEIAILGKWADTGAKRGDPKKEPKPQVFSKDWTLGQPDYVLSPSKPFRLDEEGDDVYRNFVFDLKNTEPIYVTAMDVKPGNRKVVHHVIGFLDSRGQSLKLEQANKDGQEGYTSSGGGIGTVPSGALGGWAPGVSVRKTAPGSAFVIKPGTKIVMQVHYHKSGKLEVDQTKLGLYTTKEVPSKQVGIFWSANPLFQIPVGAANHRVSWKDTIPTDAIIYSVMPHMHLLGKSMKAKVVTSEGKEIPLVAVDDWDFNWQLVYALKEPLKVKKGWRVEVEATYDNSDNNPYKTDKPVRWGEQTTDEMALLVIGYAPDREISPLELLQNKLKDIGGR
ncbi:MAG TPA: hypothetical protein VK171_12540 [Fimbriimonas sp.]|nr:hypothetical protein [Fimbriimonas sp.]